VIPVPASGDNVFKRVPGQSFWVGLALMGFTLMAGVLTAPALALVAGLFIGVGVAVAGVAVRGRVFDRTGPLLLERVRTTSGY
jgi:ABC-2 type transport system permease protein